MEIFRLADFPFTFFLQISFFKQTNKSFSELS